MKKGNYTLYLKPERVTKLSRICKHRKLCDDGGQPNFSQAIKYLIDNYAIPEEVMQQLRQIETEMEIEIT